ncbi:Eco57I restriction-modification methylase domain-containing protein [Dielma fastidiosa]|uniref:Eco57I restriction-modification methylase domain-containing protein n=1 Tax=Dielma fastidiosa TaxID=1034346 RepID=UPI0035637BB6
MQLVDKIESKTEVYIEKTSKEFRKKIGQFFTSKETAIYMASLANLKKEGSEISVLDPGCGSLILGSAVIQNILNHNKSIDKIKLTVYENDKKILGLLKSNISEIKEYSEAKGVEISINLIEKNFLLSNKEAWNHPSNEYDIIICNPPYKKINKEAQESVMMSDIVYGQPNLYYLFMALSVNMLKDNGDFIFIVPRSWVSGLYFTKFRQYLFERLDTRTIHLFQSRDEVFDKEKVLQETMIYHAVKKMPNLDTLINICSSEKNGRFDQIKKLSIRNESCIQNFNGRFLFMPTNYKEVNLLNHLNQFHNTLEELGYKLKTGPIVDFRKKEFLSDNDNDYPLIWSSNIKNARIHFPETCSNPQFIKEDKGIVLLPNKDYLILRRFTSKEENRRLQPALYLKKDLKKYKKVSFENHLNYLIKVNGDMSKEELYGLFVIFNSSFWDSYYRILNGSTQVNANEINSMPIPCIEVIKELGKKFNLRKLNNNNCDDILREVLFI